QFSNRIRKTAVKRSCLRLRRKSHILAEIMGAALNATRQFAAGVTAALLLFGWCGCASHLATVKTIPARLSTGLRVEEPLDSATKYLAAAEHEQPFTALGHDLLAAKISYAVLEHQPTNASARSLYNFAVARVVQNVDRPHHERWGRAISL